VLRPAFLNADMGISGANFLIAETGSVLIVTNEGNGRLVTTLPRVHVAITGHRKSGAYAGRHDHAAAACCPAPPPDNRSPTTCRY